MTPTRKLPVALLLICLLGCTGHNDCFGTDQGGSWVRQPGLGFVAHAASCSAMLKPYADFFESKEVAIDLAKCLSKHRWVVFAGDSNSRFLYAAMHQRLEEVLGSPFVHSEGSTGKGDQRWSDRDAVHTGTTALNVGSFHISLRFFRSAQDFDVHFGAGLFGRPKNTDNSEEEAFKRPEMVKAVGQVHKSGMTWPDTIVLSTGLWEKECANIKAVYRKLVDFKVAHDKSKILFVTPAHFREHSKIPHEFIEEASICARESQKNAIDAGHAAAAPPIWDLGQVTNGVVDKDHLGHGGGFHYTSDAGEPTPVGRVVLAGWAAFVCQTEVAPLPPVAPVAPLPSAVKTEVAPLSPSVAPPVDSPSRTVSSPKSESKEDESKDDDSAVAKALALAQKLVPGPPAPPSPARVPPPPAPSPVLGPSQAGSPGSAPEPTHVANVTATPVKTTTPSAPTTGALLGVLTRSRITRLG